MLTEEFGRNKSSRIFEENSALGIDDYNWTLYSQIWPNFHLYLKHIFYINNNIISLMNCCQIYIATGEMVI